MEQVKFVLECMWSISYTTAATEARISPASVYCILTFSLGKWKVCAKWIPRMLSNDQRAMHVLVTAYLQRFRKEGSAFCCHVLAVDESWMHSFDPQLKWQNADWCAQMSPRKKKLHCAIMHVMFLSQNGLVRDHPLPIGKMVSGQFYCAFLQDKVRSAVDCKQPEWLEYCVSLLQNNATPHHHCDVQNLMWSWGWGVGTFSLLFRFCIDYCSCERSFAGKQFESVDDMNTAVSASFIVCARVNTEM